MNHVKVITDHDLTSYEVNNIRDILLHSQCPNESLIQSIEFCKGFVNGEIHIYRGNRETKSVVIEY